ncbi:MAG TPA: glutathione S-transferase family protein [Parvibaculum sp.]|jgi:glutathione S-transferase
MLTLYHAPRSRSSRFLWLLEELGTPYHIALTSIVRRDGGEPAPESYRAIHPHLKVPAIDHDGEIVFESSAVTLYLTDTFRKNNLGPDFGEVGRADYLSWLAYSAGVIEPSATARFNKMDTGDNAKAFVDWDDVEAYVARTLEARPYVLGEKFSGADILIGSMLQFFKGNLLPERKVYDDYFARISARPAYIRAQEKDSGPRAL